MRNDTLFWGCLMKKNFILPITLMLASCSYFAPSSTSEPAPEVQTEMATEEETQTFYLTEAYEVAATRITNKMLNDTVEIYQKQPQPKIYIKETVKSETAPDGNLETAQKAMRTLIKGTNSYIVANTETDADFILESSVNDLDTGGQPAIQFKLSLNDKALAPVQAWSVVIKQMPEDKSWW